MKHATVELGNLLFYKSRPVLLNRSRKSDVPIEKNHRMNDNFVILFTLKFNLNTALWMLHGNQITLSFCRIEIRAPSSICRMKIRSPCHFVTLKSAHHSRFAALKSKYHRLFAALNSVYYYLYRRIIINTRYLLILDII